MRILLPNLDTCNSDAGKHSGELPRWLHTKESAFQWRRVRFDPWVRKIPWRRKWKPTPVFLPGKSQGQRSLMCYNPWGHKESGTTERLSTHLSRESTSAAPAGPLTVNSKHLEGLPGQQGRSSCGAFSPRVPSAPHWRNTYKYQKGPQGPHGTTCQTRSLGLDTGDFVSVS